MLKLKKQILQKIEDYKQIGSYMSLKESVKYSAELRKVLVNINLKSDIETLKESLILVNRVYNDFKCYIVYIEDLVNISPEFIIDDVMLSINNDIIVAILEKNYELIENNLYLCGMDYKNQTPIKLQFDALNYINSVDLDLPL